MPIGEFEVIVEDDKEMFTDNSGSGFSEEEEGGLHGGRGIKRETYIKQNDELQNCTGAELTE